jgi:hypothetical protein
VDLHLVVPRFFDAERLHRIDDEVDRVALSATGTGDTIVHFDPCRPRHCPGCRLDDCAVRSQAFVAREPLALERATRADETLDTGQPLDKDEP